MIRADMDGVEIVLCSDYMVIRNSVNKTEFKIQASDYVKSGVNGKQHMEFIRDTLVLFLSKLP